MIILAKNYNYIFEFVKVMSKVLLLPFFTDTDPKLAFFNDVTITTLLQLFPSSNTSCSLSCNYL